MARNKQQSSPAEPRKNAKRKRTTTRKGGRTVETNKNQIAQEGNQ
jgi:hypothetical protein